MILRAQPDGHVVLRRAMHGCSLYDRELSGGNSGNINARLDDGLLVTVKLYLLLKGLDVRLLNDDQVAEVRAAFPN